MKIERVKYEPNTMSVPAFLDVWLEDGTKITFKGKNANKNKDRFKEGEEYKPVQ